jgi:hypothetical protein
MWYVVCSQELLARLKRYLKRVLRRCVVVAFKVKANGRNRKCSGGSNTTVALFVPHRRYVIILLIARFAM